MNPKIDLIGGQGDEDGEWEDLEDEDQDRRGDPPVMLQGLQSTYRTTNDDHRGLWMDTEDPMQQDFAQGDGG